MSDFRRQFLADVGRGMLVAGLGAPLAFDLGLASAFAGDVPESLNFGELEPLVSLLQETPKDKVLPLVVEKLNGGLELKQLTAAATFANARTFGGENYFGFHTFMAIAPAYQMAAEMPKGQAALPLLKVLYRNAHYSQEVGGRKSEVLKPLEANDRGSGEAIRQAVNAGDRKSAEQSLAAVSKISPEAALEAALLGVEDNHDVHTVVLPWRAYAMLDIVGQQHATTLLRQSVRQTAKQCADHPKRIDDLAKARAILPRLLEKHQLPKDKPGTRNGENGWIDQLVNTILNSSPELAGEAVAMVLAEGFSSEHVGEAVSLAANQLVLRQVENWEGKNYGRRTHGDSPGVHASDATNAWRNIARVIGPRGRAAGLILAAMDVAQSHTWSLAQKNPGHAKEPFPRPQDLEAVKAATPEAILKDLDGAIRENDQLRAAALVQKYSQLDQPEGPVFDLLLQYAVSEDGRLHSEKYYSTVRQEFATTRPTFRWRQIIALARVTASMYGYTQQDAKGGRAPGYDESRRLLKV